MIIAQENHSIFLDGDDFDRSEIDFVVQFNERTQLLQRSMTTDRILKETVVTIRTIVMVDLVEILRETNVDVKSREESNWTNLVGDAMRVGTDVTQTSVTFPIDETSFYGLIESVSNGIDRIGTDGVGCVAYSG